MAGQAMSLRDVVLPYRGTSKEAAPATAWDRGEMWGIRPNHRPAPQGASVPRNASPRLSSAPGKPPVFADIAHLNPQPLAEVFPRWAILKRNHCDGHSPEHGQHSREAPSRNPSSRTPKSLSQRLSPPQADRENNVIIRHLSSCSCVMAREERGDSFKNSPRVSPSRVLSDRSFSSALALTGI